MKINNRLRLSLARLLWQWTPHTTQRIWLLDDHKVKVASCGRRWGKTEAAAVDAATYALCCPGSVQMIVSPTYDQSRLIFDTVERMLCRTNTTNRFTKVVRTPYPRISVAGSLIMARTADEDGRNLRGHSADRVIVDEAAYIKDAVIDEVIAPMLADRDGQMILISTPAGRNHFYRAFMRGLEPTGRRAVKGASGEVPVEESGLADDGVPAARNPVSTLGRYASFHFPSWLNPHISKDYIEHQRGVLTQRQFKVEYEAEFLDDQKAVFPWVDIQNAVENNIEPRRTSGEYIAAGIDWARYSDYTAVVILDASEEPFRVIALDRFHGLPWSAQIERVADLLEAYKTCFVVTDATSVGDPLLEQLRRRLAERGRNRTNIQGITFTTQSKRDLVDNLAIGLAHKRFRIPNDENLVQELQYFEFETTSSGHLRMNARTGYHDDLVIALSLAAWGATSNGSAPANYLASGTLQEHVRGEW